MQTRTILAATAGWSAEGASQPTGFFTLGGRSGCRRDQSPPVFGPRVTYSDLDPWNSQTVQLRTASTGVGTVALEAGTAYRLTVSLVPSTGCSQGPTGARVCPDIVIRVGDREVLTQAIDGVPG